MKKLVLLLASAFVGHLCAAAAGSSVEIAKKRHPRQIQVTVQVTRGARPEQLKTKQDASGQAMKESTESLPTPEKIAPFVPQLAAIKEEVARVKERDKKVEDLFTQLASTAVALEKDHISPAAAYLFVEGQRQIGEILRAINDLSIILNSYGTMRRGCKVAGCEEVVEAQYIDQIFNAMDTRFATIKAHDARMIEMAKKWEEHNKLPAPSSPQVTALKEAVALVKERDGRIEDLFQQLTSIVASLEKDHVSLGVGYLFVDRQQKVNEIVRANTLLVEALNKYRMARKSCKGAGCEEAAEDQYIGQVFDRVDKRFATIKAHDALMLDWAKKWEEEHNKLPAQ